MSNELEAILTGGEQLQKLLHFLHVIYTEERLTFANIALNRQIAESLMRVTDNGTKVPYVMPYGAEYSVFGSQLIQKMKEYNLNKKGQDKIDYFTTKGIDGKQIIWTNEKGADIINNLRKQLAISKGLYFTEISKEDMLNSSKGEQLYVLKDIDIEDIDMLKSKPLKSGNDYSFSVMQQENGKYSIFVQYNDFLNKDLNKKDLFKDLIHAKVSRAFNQDVDISKELAYDRELKNRAIEYTPETLNEPTYITSSTDGGRYIEISKNGFTVYNTGMNVNDLRQTIALKMEYPANKEDLKEYKKQLYREINKLNRPVEINNSIYKQHQNDLQKVFGDNPPDLSKDSKCIDNIRNSFSQNVKLSFEPELDANDSNALIKELIFEDKKATVLNVAAKAAVDIVKKDSIPTKENIYKAIERQDIEKLLKDDFYKNQLYHEDKDLCLELNHAIQNTALYQSIQNSRLDTVSKEEMNKIIDNSYADFLKEVDEDLRGRVKAKYKEYKKEMVDNIEKCIENNLTVKNISEIKEIQNEKENNALKVVLANCITGNPIDCIRPINNSIEKLQQAERNDELIKAFAKEVEQKILDKYPDKQYPDNFFKKDIYNENGLSKIIKETAKELSKDMEDGTLEDRSEEWAAVYYVCNERGEMTYRTWNELADLTCQVISDDPSLIVCNREELEKFAKSENLKEMTQGYVDILEYEHDEEEITRALCDKIQEENIEFSGTKNIGIHNDEPDIPDYEEEYEFDID